MLHEWAVLHASTLNVTHGDAGKYEKAPEYHSFGAMHSRCYRPKDASYPRYGAIGIAVCERWFRYENFIADMGRKPHPEYSLDRIDVSLGYSPENCRWASPKTQMNNRGNNLRTEFQGRTQTLVQWAEEFGMAYETLRARHHKGWSMERIHATPVRLNQGKPTPAGFTGS